MRLPDDQSQSRSYMCKMTYLHPGAIGGEEPAKDLNTLGKLWAYIQHPNAEKWTGDFDYQLIICQDYTEFEKEIADTKALFAEHDGRSVLSILLVSFMSFGFLGFRIYKFALQVTRPIE